MRRNPLRRIEERISKRTAVNLGETGTPPQSTTDETSGVGGNDTTDPNHKWVKAGQLSVDTFGSFRLG